jgi:hypothetical protein
MPTKKKKIFRQLSPINVDQEIRLVVPSKTTVNIADLTIPGTKNNKTIRRSCSIQAPTDLKYEIKVSDITAVFPCVEDSNFQSATFTPYVDDVLAVVNDADSHKNKYNGLGNTLNNKTLIIPVVQCSHYSILGIKIPFIPRKKHFVTLIISPDKKEMLVLDSRPAWLKLFYNDPLKKIAKKYGLAYRHLSYGLQKDRYRCGSYCIHTVKHAANKAINTESSKSDLRKKFGDQQIKTDHQTYLKNKNDLMKTDKTTTKKPKKTVRIVAPCDNHTPAEVSTQDFLSHASDAALTLTYLKSQLQLYKIKYPKHPADNKKNEGSFAYTYQKLLNAESLSDAVSHLNNFKNNKTIKTADKLKHSTLAKLFKHLLNYSNKRCRPHHNPTQIVITSPTDEQLVAHYTLRLLEEYLGNQQHYLLTKNPALSDDISDLIDSLNATNAPDLKDISQKLITLDENAGLFSINFYKLTQKVIKKIGALSVKSTSTNKAKQLALRAQLCKAMLRPKHHAASAPKCGFNAYHDRFFNHDMTKQRPTTKTAPPKNLPPPLY